MQCNKSLEVIPPQDTLISSDRLPKQSPIATHPPMDQSAFDLARSLTNQSTAAAAAANGVSQKHDSDIERDAAQDFGSNLEKARSSGSRRSKDPFLVQWEEGDKENPMNWGMSRKWFLVVFLSWITLLTSVFADHRIPVRKNYLGAILTYSF